MKKLIVCLLLMVTTTIFGQEIPQTFKEVYLSVQDTDKKDFASREAYLTRLSNIMTEDLKKISDKENQLIYKANTAEIFANITADSNKNEMTKAAVKELYSIEAELVAYEKANKVSGSFYTTIANISGRILHFESLASTIKISKRNLDYFNKAIKINKNDFSAYLGMALWYFYAPKVGGGDINKSMNYINQAEKIATFDYQKYQIYVWKSQLLFKQNKKNDSKLELQKANAIYPKGEFHKIVEQANSHGNFFKMK